MKIGVEILRDIRDKLCMMGVFISGPSYLYGNNMSGIHNTQQPKLTLKRRTCPFATMLFARL
jgi:hypothetical protein